jgi:NAD(P)H-dependent FMN reductase
MKVHQTKNRMSLKKNMFIIIGSASKNSANEKLIANFISLTKDFFETTVFTGLKSLPHFDPELSTNRPPQSIVDFRRNIEQADGIVICTPEYIFSIPAGLKNALEWCVATTLFSEKPLAIITASADGRKAHEELQLIMKTLMAKFTEATAFLIQGVRGQVNEKGEIINKKIESDFVRFIQAFMELTGVSENKLNVPV